jgi:hypothetical protein
MFSYISRFHYSILLKLRSQCKRCTAALDIYTMYCIVH